MYLSVNLDTKEGQELRKLLKEQNKTVGDTITIAFQITIKCLETGDEMTGKEADTVAKRGGDPGRDTSITELCGSVAFWEPLEGNLSDGI